MEKINIQLEHLDHLVLTVRNIDVTCKFYSHVLGMQVIDFEYNHKALQFGTQKLNLHERGKEFVPKAARPTPGSADLCFITTVPLDRVVEHLQLSHVAILEGPVEQTGATGTLRSIYFRDPDGNLIEVANYVD